LLALRLFPVPLVLQNVTVTKALGDVGAFVQHGYALFGVELRLTDGQEPRVSIDLPAGSTLGDALRQILKQLPGRRRDINYRKKEVSSLTLPYPRQTTTRKGGIYEPGNVDNNSDRCVLYDRAMHDAANTKSVGPECWR
jgi:hypothetical protein